MRTENRRWAYRCEWRAIAVAFVALLLSLDARTLIAGTLTALTPVGVSPGVTISNHGYRFQPDGRGQHGHVHAGLTDPSGVPRLRIVALAEVQPAAQPTLSAGFRYVESVEVSFDGGPFNRLHSLTLTESQQRRSRLRDADAAPSGRPANVPRTSAWSSLSSRIVIVLPAADLNPAWSASAGPSRGARCGLQP